MEKKISVISATYNSIKSIVHLAESLKVQTDRNFDWIIADGGSTDGTLDYLKGINDLNIIIIEGPDFGIYDALNRAIRASRNEYYLVLGSDDIIFKESIGQLRRQIVSESQISFYIFATIYKNKIRTPKKSKPWLNGQFCYISTHSVGMLIKKDLHYTYGFYSNKFPIAADQYFILKVMRYGGTIKFVEDYVVGIHGSDGVSGTDSLGVISEFYRVQVELKYNKILQTLLFILRLLKNFSKF